MCGRMSQLHSGRNDNEEEFSASGLTFGEIGVVSPDYLPCGRTSFATPTPCKMSPKRSLPPGSFPQESTPSCTTASSAFPASPRTPRSLRSPRRELYGTFRLTRYRSATSQRSLIEPSLPSQHSSIANGPLGCRTQTTEQSVLQPLSSG